MSDRRRALVALGFRSAGAIVDQAMSSLQNFVILFAALHYLDLSGVGSFTLAYTTDLLILSTVRSLVLEALTIRHTLDDIAERREAAASAAGASLGIGLVLAILGVATWLVAPSTASAIIGASACILPVLLVQDACRYHLFSSRRPWSAAINDGLCFITTLGLALALGRLVDPTVVSLMSLWGLGTFAGVLIGLAQLGSAPKLHQGWLWLRRHHDLGLRLAGETLAQQAAGRLSLFLLTLIVSVSALGELSSSRTLMTPSTTLISSVFAFAVPEAVRLRRMGPRKLDQFVVTVSIVMGALVILFTICMYLIPDTFGRVLAGQNWETSKVLLVPTAVWVVGMAINQGPRLGLRALDQPRLILHVAIFMGIALLAGTVIGGFLDAARGAAWGFGLVSLLGTVPWTFAYLHARNASRAAHRAASRRGR